MHPLFHAFLSQQADGGSASPFGMGSPLLMVALMFGVFYFVLWRPQSKERKKVESFRQNLKKGDRVWTQGGIVGTVWQVDDQGIVLDVGAGNKLRVLKAFIGGEFKEKSETAEPAKVEAKK
jgi:preprotein translocase subunit YajC